MRAARIVVALAPLLVTCGGSVEDPAPSITIVRASVRDDGSKIAALIDARLVGGAMPGSLDLWAGAAWERSRESMYETGGCSDYAGWRLDLDPGSRRHALGAREERFVTLRATSFRQPACAPDALVAVCGQPITLVLRSEPVAGDAYPTALSCVLGNHGS